MWHQPSSCMSLVKGSVTHSIKPLSSNRATPISFQHVGCVHLGGLLTQNPQPAFLCPPLSPAVRSGVIKRKPNFIRLESGLLWYPKRLFVCSSGESLLSSNPWNKDLTCCFSYLQCFVTAFYDSCLRDARLSNLSCSLFPGLMGGLWECTFVGVFNSCS